MEEVASYTRSLIESSLDPLVTIAIDGAITDVNLATEQITGYSKEELIGTDFANYFTEPTKATAGYLEVYEQGSVRDYFLELKHKRGTVTPVLYNASVYKDKTGNVVGVFAAARDISQQIETEKQLREANRSKSIFLAHMSHELRTPMHGILSFANFGIKKIDTAPKDKLFQYFTLIKTSGDRLLSLLNDLLDLSKFDAGKMVMDIKEADLVSLFTSCQLEQEQRIQDLGLSLEINTPTQPVIGLFDPIRIGQVITNILSNAIKFSPENSVLTVTMDKNDKNELLFSLKDTGVGIPKSELNDVFDVFIQSSKTDTGAGGTGLGLAICAQIIEAHNGKIWAENNIDDGTVFTFILPQVIQ